MRRTAGTGLAMVGALVILLSACSSDGGKAHPASTRTTSVPSMRLTSPAFHDGEPIPERYTCAGPDGTAAGYPMLQWSTPPPATKELAVLVVDPDASRRGFVHFLLYGIDPNRSGIGGGVPTGATPGMNSLGREWWVPPCPPSGGTHHYEFTVFALDRHPEIALTANVEQFLDGIRGSVLARGRLTGTYGR